MVGGCRIHAHSRGMNDYALSSGEGEIVATSELMKDGILVKFNLEFAGMGSLPIQMFTDATVARQFVHRLGVGRMKHLDVRLCWLQDQHKKGVFISKKIPREIIQPTCSPMCRLQRTL